MNGVLLHEDLIKSEVSAWSSSIVSEQIGANRCSVLQSGTESEWLITGTCISVSLSEVDTSLYPWLCAR